MKFTMTILSLCLMTGFNALAKETAISRKAASVAGAQQAAEQIVKSLYGRKTDPIRSQVSGPNSYDVTVGDGSAMNGSALYRVEFKKLNLTGASNENEQVADIQITYLSGN